MLRDSMYKKGFERFHWDLCRCLEGWNGGLLQAKNVACDGSTLEIEGNLDCALVTGKISKQKDPRE